ncbi:hypothetical protein BGZ90_008157 [Linnemannia elongata]|nr:hypothetical protein BGZ90_008157 [Linnemannia elongata]
MDECQDAQCKDIVLVKDAQVAMSCVLNTMSKRACRHFEKLEQEHLVETAKTLCTLKGSEQHEYTQILKRYVSTLASDGINKLKAKLIIDRGSIFKKYEDQERLPASVELEDKILQILIILLLPGKYKDCKVEIKQ